MRKAKHRASLGVPNILLYIYTHFVCDNPWFVKPRQWRNMDNDTQRSNQCSLDLDPTIPCKVMQRAPISRSPQCMQPRDRCASNHASGRVCDARARIRRRQSTAGRAPWTRGQEPDKRQGHIVPRELGQAVLVHRGGEGDDIRRIDMSVAARDDRRASAAGTPKSTAPEEPSTPPALLRMRKRNRVTLET